MQERLEATTRLLLALQDAPGHKAQELKLRLSIASRIGREWHSSQQALDKALKAASLTHGESSIWHQIITQPLTKSLQSSFLTPEGNTPTNLCE